MNETAADPARASRLFHALSDETRLRIIELLCDGECCVCELQAELDAYQSRLSFHLRKLKDAGVVSGRREGRWVYYALRPEAFALARGWLASLTPRPAPSRGADEGARG